MNFEPLQDEDADISQLSPYTPAEIRRMKDELKTNRARSRILRFELERKRRFRDTFEAKERYVGIWFFFTKNKSVKPLSNEEWRSDYLLRSKTTQGTKIKILQSFDGKMCHSVINYKEKIPLVFFDSLSVRTRSCH